MVNNIQFYLNLFFFIFLLTFGSSVFNWVRLSEPKKRGHSALMISAKERISEERNRWVFTLCYVRKQISKLLIKSLFCSEEKNQQKKKKNTIKIKKKKEEKERKSSTRIKTECFPFNILHIVCIDQSRKTNITRKKKNDNDTYIFSAYFSPWALKYFFIGFSW